MKSVFVLLLYIDYEGGDIQSIHDTESSAQIAASRYVDSHSKYNTWILENKNKWRGQYETLLIREFKVEE